MGNETSHPEFNVLGLSDLTHAQIPIFLLIVLIYVATLAGNLLIISLVASDSHLQTPMYFFLGNLSTLDIFNSTISVSHLPYYIFTGNWLILYSTCIAQVFFFTWFVGTSSYILVMMSLDRYVAICHPLRYTTIISLHLCVGMAFFSWTIGFVFSLLPTLCTLSLAFPDPTTIPGLFCELYQLVELSCSDTFFNYLILYIEAVCCGVTGFFITILSYVYIYQTILKMKSRGGIRKAYSTCTSHLTVVFIFYGASCFNYIQTKSEHLFVGRLLSIFYTVITPLLNPIIYSLRNNEIKEAFRKILPKMDSKS